VPRGRSEVVRVELHTDTAHDAGLGVVICNKPLLLLVPSHVVALLEADAPVSISVAGNEIGMPEIISVPGLDGDHLSLLRFKKAGRKGAVARFNKSAFVLSEGHEVILQRCNSSDDCISVGKVVKVLRACGGTSIATNISVSAGESGAPLLVDEKIVGICQGYAEDAQGERRAIAIPLSHRSLAEIRHTRLVCRASRTARHVIILLVALAALAALAFSRFSRFEIGSIELSEDKQALIVHNSSSLSLRDSWSRVMPTPIRRYMAFSSLADDGTDDRIAVGTHFDGETNGSLSVFDSRGKLEWTYSIPNGECIYSEPGSSCDGFLVDRLHVSDLDRDGQNEILAVFVHDHFFPCKLVVLNSSGAVLAEYWHHGYIRTIDSGSVGEQGDVLVVASASNNAYRTGDRNPQTLFAFKGLDISGQSPPYLGSAAEGSELWYYVLPDFTRDDLGDLYDEVDRMMIRIQCYDIDFTDVDGDGDSEIRAALTDGRFYNLDETGMVLSTFAGDKYLGMYGDRAIPDLVPVPLGKSD